VTRIGTRSRRLCCTSAVIAIAGCASTEDPSLGARVVVPIHQKPASAEASPSGMTPDEARGAIAEIENDFEAGDVAAAAERLESVPMNAVPLDLREKYSRLRRDVRRAELQEVAFSATAEVEPFSGVAGATVPVALHLLNRSAGTISIPASRSTGFLGLGPDERSIVDVEIEYHEFDREGSRYETSWHRQIPLRKDLALDSGTSFDLRFTVPTDDDKLRLDRVVFRRLVVKATLWPLAISMGKSVYLAPIVFRPATADLVPRGAEPLRDDPAAALKRALGVRGRADVSNHVFLAGILLMQKDAAAGAAALQTALVPGDLETEIAAVSALRVATGDFDQDDPDAWRNWCATKVAEAAR
jgi:hypothetical protein